MQLDPMREVMVSGDNRVTGVRFIDRTTRAEGEVRGKSVVVACACVQSVALLLMSKSARYPTGLANSSGELGRNFIPHFTGGVQCFLTGLIGKPAANDEGFLDHAYLPSFMHNRGNEIMRAALGPSSITRTGGLWVGPDRCRDSERDTRSLSNNDIPRS